MKRKILLTLAAVAAVVGVSGCLNEEEVVSRCAAATPAWWYAEGFRLTGAGQYWDDTHGVMVWCDFDLYTGGVDYQRCIKVRDSDRYAWLYYNATCVPVV